MPPLRDLLAFVIGSAGVMSDFYGALDLHLGHQLAGVGLLLLGLAALWGAFRLGTGN